MNTGTAAHGAGHDYRTQRGGRKQGHTWVPDDDHLRPHTSCVCACSRPCTCSLMLRDEQTQQSQITILPDLAAIAKHHGEKGEKVRTVSGSESV